MYHQILLAVFGAAVLIPIILRYMIFPLKAQSSVGFFHPFTEDGGGGERVLWCAVQCLQWIWPQAECVIYTGDLNATSETLASRADELFGIELQRDVRVIHLKFRKAVESATWPRLTLLGQALGSVALTFEALRKHVPTMFFDTAGYAFGYPLARFVGSATVAYVHYPFVSSDMLTRVKERKSSFNNDDAIAGSGWKTALKLQYYRALAVAYGCCGSRAQVVMVNSTWTSNHIKSLWGGNPRTVFPPCDTASLQGLPPLPRSPVVLSVAQFRPEKDHALQIKAYALARRAALHVSIGPPSSSRESPHLDEASVRRLAGTLSAQQAEAVLLSQLVLVGGCRNAHDRARLADLKRLADHLAVGSVVEFRVDVEYGELVDLLGRAVAGLHTMQDEHFGISIVEYMAAAAVPIAHRSGGPLSDIVVPEVPGQCCGYLAETQEEYAQCLLEVLSMDVSQRSKVAANARNRSLRFSEEAFMNSLRTALESHVPGRAKTD